MADRPELAAACKTTKAELQALNPEAVHIFTDGSCSRADGSGGWGAVLLFRGHKRRAHGGWPEDCKIGGMELTGILEGLGMVKDWTRKVIVYTDSQYAANALSVWWQGWARNDWYTATGAEVANKEVIQAILALIRHRVVAFKWIKGHVSKKSSKRTIANDLNDEADELAGKARRAAVSTGKPVRTVYAVESPKPAEGQPRVRHRPTPPDTAPRARSRMRVA